MQELKANTQVIVHIGPFPDVGDGFTPQIDIDISATNEAELLKHGASTVTDISGATWAAIANCRGWYNLTLTTSYTNTEGMLEVVIQDDSDCLPVHVRFMVLSQAAWDSKYAAKDNGFMDVNIKAVNEDTTAAGNLESQYNTTGLLGDTFPLRQDQGASISGGLAVRTAAASVTVIQGSEQDLANASTSNDSRWTGDDDGAGAEFIFRYTSADTSATPGDLHFEGFYDEPTGATNSATFEIYNFISSSWDVLETLTNSSTDELHDHQLLINHSAPGSGTVETVAHTIGDVLIKFQQTAQETGNAVLNIDAMHVGFISSPVTATEIVDEWETQSQADPTGFHVNIQEWIGTAVTLSSTSTKPEVDVFSLSDSVSAANNQETLYNGVEGFAPAYAGPRGPGVYLNDAVGNENTVNGVDGTWKNPVSTIAATKTIADSLSVDRVYLINDSSITLTATMEDYEFIGIGEMMANTVNFGTQDVDNAVFYNLLLTGAQGGTGRCQTIGCVLSVITGMEITATSCVLADAGSLTLRDDCAFDSCYSAVAGAGTPTLDINSVANVNVYFRHYSGGLTVANAVATTVMSYEADGQLVVDASCTSLTIVPRGNLSITDNGTTTNINLDAAINLTNINAEADTALADYDGPTNTEMLAAHTTTDGLISGLNNFDGTGATLHSDYDAAKTAAQAGDLMGLSADAITAAKIADNAFAAEHFAASSLDGKGDWNTVTPDAAGTDVTVDDITTAALAKFMTEDTGETIGAAGSVAKIAQGTASGLTAAAVADAVYDEALADHTASGSGGEAWNRLNDIQLATDQIGSAFITSSSPVASTGAIELYQYDDYHNTESRSLEWSNTDGDWGPDDITDATVEFLIRDSAGTIKLEVAGSVVTPTGTQVVRVVLANTDTADLTTTARYEYQLRLILDSSERQETIATGVVAVTNSGFTS